MKPGRQWALALCATLLTACGESPPSIPSGGDTSDTTTAETSDDFSTTATIKPVVPPEPAPRSTTTTKPKPPAPGNPARIFLPDQIGIPWPVVWTNWEQLNSECRPLDGCVSFTFVANGAKVPRSKLGENCTYKGKSAAKSSDGKYAKGEKISVTLKCGEPSSGESTKPS